MDSLIDSLELARKNGIDVPVEESVLEELWRKTTRSRILAILTGRPMPAEWIGELVNMPLDMVLKSLRKLMERGEVIYIYTHLGKTYALTEDAEILYEEYSEYLSPDHGLNARVKPYIEYGELKAVSGTYNIVRDKLAKLMKRHGKFTKLSATLQVPLETGALQQVILHYTFTISDQEILDLVLKNIYSAPKYSRYIYRLLTEER